MGDRGPQPRMEEAELKRRLTELRRAGKTYKEIAKALGCYSPGYISLLIYRLDICKRGSVAFGGLPVYGGEQPKVRPEET